MAKPYLKAGRDHYYVDVKIEENGRTKRRPVKLCHAKEGFQEALRIWHQKMVEHDEGTLGKDPKLRQVVDGFLEWSSNPRNNAPGTYKWYQFYLSRFLETTIAAKRVSDLTEADIEDWLNNDFYNHSETARGHAIRCIKRSLNWAKRRKLIRENPLTELRRPKSKSRGRKTITAEQWKELYQAVEKAGDEPFLALITLLRHTGCRVTEFRLVEAKWFDREGRRWVFPDEDHTDRRRIPRKLWGRIVYLLDDVSYHLSLAAAVAHPEGRMFRPADSDHWTESNIHRRFKKYSKKLGTHLYAYKLRHTYATDAIDKNVNLRTLQAMMGWKNLSMISEVYGHPEERPDSMRLAHQMIMSAEPINQHSPKAG
jgi:site-specific recombinase XerD